MKMPTYNSLLYEKQRNGVLITWNRPESLNSISREMEHELAAALTEAERDPEVRAVVMTGMGRAFSSGYDIGGERPDPEWPSGIPEGHSVAEMIDDWRTHSRAQTEKLMQLWELSKPVRCRLRPARSADDFQHQLHLAPQRRLQTRVTLWTNWRSYRCSRSPAHWHH